MQQEEYAVLDWDYTLHDGYTMFQWADYLLAEGVLSDQFSKVVKSLDIKYRQGKITHDQYAEYSGLAYAKSLKGVRAEELDNRVSAFVERNSRYLYPFVQELFQWFRRNAIKVIVVTGAPGEVLKGYSRLLGPFESRSFEAKKKNGVYTGEISQHYGFGKEKVVGELRSVYRKAPLVGWGDSGSDLSLLQAAEYAYLVGDKEKEMPDGIRQKAIFVPCRCDWQDLVGKLPLDK